MSDPDLQPGDIILALGKGPLADAIRVFTGGQYSHASIWTGVGVLEATTPRVQEISLEDFKRKTRCLGAYRRRDADDRKARIVERGRSFIDCRYGAVNLIIAAAIGTFTAWARRLDDMSAPSRRTSINGGMLAGAASDVKEWAGFNAQYHAGRLKALVEQLRIHCKIVASSSAVTCVELVLLAHRDAECPIEVKLDLGGRVDFPILWEAIKRLYELSREVTEKLEARLVGATGLLSLDSLARETRWVVDNQDEMLAGMRPAERAGDRLNPADYEASVAALKELVLVPDGMEWDPGLVTPKQLEHSRSLQYLGAIPT